VFYRYNGLDNAVTREIRDVQHRELDSYGTWDTFKHSMSLVQPLMAATNRGIKVDLAERERLRVECQQKVAHWQAVLDGSAEGSVNVKSSKQVKELLYGKLGFAAKRQRGTGKISADKDAIAALAGRYEHPSLKAIIQIREQRDLLERYLNARLDADGRMRCSFDITGTRSGRLSSRMSIYGSGTNLQTIPPDLRRMFVADEGKVFVYRDYSQAEARVVAYLARCPKLIEVFEDPTRSIHKENASRIFNIPVEKISKKSSEYFLGKVVGHSTNYGGTEASTMETVNAAADETGIRVTLQQMRIIKERYLAIYPEIVENFWADVERQLAKDRTLTSPFGRKRTYYGRYDDKLRRDAYSWIPQSTVGDLGTRAIVRVCHEIPEAEFLLNVHDSLLVQCDVDKAIRVAKAMEHSMDIPITIHGVEVHIPSDCKIGYNWGEADESNPLGLMDLEQWEAAYGRSLAPELA
jgi:DNA polymerase-1